MSHHLRKKMLTCADKFVYALCKLHEKIPLIKALAEDLYEVCGKTATALFRNMTQHQSML